MGIWSGRQISQGTFSGWMSSKAGFDYFLGTVLPDILANGASITSEGTLGTGGPPTVPVTNMMMEVSRVAGLNGWQIPQSSLDAVNNPPPPAAQAVDIPAAPTEAGQGDAKTRLKDFLDSMGLGSEIDWAWDLHTKGYSDDSIAILERDRDAYKKRFHGLVKLRESGVSMSEAEAMNYEKTMFETLHQFGITRYTRDDLQNWLGDGKSIAEQASRIKIGSDLVYAVPEETRAFMKDFYGIDEGDLTDWAVNRADALPAIQKKVDAAAIAGAAKRAKFGLLDVGQAEMIAGYTDPQSAASTLTQVGQTRALYEQDLPGEGDITLQDVIAGYFGGDAEQLNRLRRRDAQRRAQFAGGGGVSQSTEGAVGAGVARPA